MSFHRRYWILKTGSADTIGVVSVVCAPNDAGMFEFSLHLPQYQHSDGEFLDLSAIEINQPEFETHKDVFETVEEVEIVKEWSNTTGMGTAVLVRRAEKKP